MIKERTVLSIPDASSLSVAEIDRIMSASLTKIAFIKSPGGRVAVREIDYIPTTAYLNNKRFDLSSLEMGTKNFDFTGRVIVKKWDGKRVSSYKVENGKFLQKGIIKTADSKTNLNPKEIISSPNTEGCTTYEICEYERECEEVHIGDAWVPTGSCTSWQPTGYCWTEEYCDGGGGGGCESMSTQECSCMLYGLGCEDGGDDDPPPSEPDPRPLRSCR